MNQTIDVRWVAQIFGLIGIDTVSDRIFTGEHFSLKLRTNLLYKIFYFEL